MNNLKMVSSLLQMRLVQANELFEMCKPLINKQRKRMIDILKEKSIKVSQMESVQKMQLLKQYIILEMSPPAVNEIQKLQHDIILAKDFFQTGCYKYLTVKQAWLLFLVCTEIGLWFFMGETIGKMHIVGYKV